jgi:hypothetical protein
MKELGQRSVKNSIMKSSRSQTTKQSKQGISHRPKPQERDDLDSRKEKEKTKSQTNKVNKENSME